MDRRGRPVLDGDVVSDSRSRSGALAGTDPGAQLFIVASLLILAGLAWAWTVAMAAMPEWRRLCRVPLLFLGHHWRDGAGGALLLGAHHGLYCAGCCASLMVVLLVVGVMNVGWMVALSALIYLEKVLPAGGRVGRLAGLGLCAAGAARMLG